MRRQKFPFLIFSIVLSLLFCIEAEGVSAAVIIRPPNNLGLVGYWSFDEGRGTQAGDMSGNGNHGTLHNGPVWTAGKSRGALALDGVDDYVNLSSIDTSGLTNATVSFWRKSNSSARWLLFRGQTNSFYLMAVSTGNFYHANAGSGITIYEDGQVVTKDTRDGEWHHYVATGVNLSSWTALTLSNYSGFQYNGDLDDLRIYNRVLSASEVQSLYANTRSTTVGITPTDRYNNGLVGHWTFDGKHLTATTAEDVAGSNDGTIYGATPTRGIIGQAMQFDGVNDYIDAGNAGSFNDNFSVSLWIKSDNYTVGRGIFTRTNLGSYWTTPGFSITNISNPRRVYLKVTDGTNFIERQLITEDERYGWTHIAVTRNEDTLTSYANGSLLGTNNLSAIGSISGSQSLFMGRGNGGAWDGSMDDVRIYNRALSATEVAGLYSATSSSKMKSSTDELVTSGLVGHWSFDSSTVSGNTVQDLSGNGNDATIVGNLVTVTGKIGEAMMFDGVDDYVDLPNDLGYTTEFSAFAWFKSEGVPSGNYHIILGGQELEISIPHPGGQIRTGVFTNIRRVSNHGSGLLNGNWHHLGVIFDGSTKKSYIDGEFVGELTGITGALTSSFSNRRMGRFGSNSLYYTNGAIDDVRIYNRALTEEEITQLYSMGQ